MKKETKELLEWIKNIIYEHQKTLWFKDKTEEEKEEDNRCSRAKDFLDSLSEIESHLCNGGYIQDRNGKPCCSGDKIKFKFSEKDFNEHWKDKYAHIEYGELKFDLNDKRFVILFGEDKSGFDWIDWNGAFEGCEWFEKVEG